MRQNPPGLVTPTFRVGESIEPILSIGTSDRPPFGFNYPVIPAGSLDENGGIVGARPGAGGIDRDIKADSTMIYNAGVERRLPTTDRGGHHVQRLVHVEWAVRVRLQPVLGRSARRPARSAQSQLRPDVLRAECEQDLLQRDHVLGPPGHRPQQLPGELHVLQGGGLRPGRHPRESRSWICDADRPQPVAVPRPCGLGRAAPAGVCRELHAAGPIGLGPAEVHPRRMADHRAPASCRAARRSPSSPTRRSRPSWGPTVRSWASHRTAAITMRTA